MDLLILGIMMSYIDGFTDCKMAREMSNMSIITATYAKLKEKYISLKALLYSLGVNMADIDRIKE